MQYDLYLPFGCCSQPVYLCVCAAAEWRAMNAGAYGWQSIRAFGPLGISVLRAEVGAREWCVCS